MSMHEGPKRAGRAVPDRRDRGDRATQHSLRLGLGWDAGSEKTLKQRTKNIFSAVRKNVTLNGS